MDTPSRGAGLLPHRLGSIQPIRLVLMRRRLRSQWAAPPGAYGFPPAAAIPAVHPVVPADADVLRVPAARRDPKPQPPRRPVEQARRRSQPPQLLSHPRLRDAHLIVGESEIA